VSTDKDLFYSCTLSHFSTSSPSSFCLRLSHSLFLFLFLCSTLRLSPSRVSNLLLLRLPYGEDAIVPNQETMASQDVPVDDGEKSLSEKMAKDQAAAELENRGEIANLPPDPDAHLSPEERAKIVRLS
jgi:hypothetical protein